jgi:hypothetical protein
MNTEILQLVTFYRTNFYTINFYTNFSTPLQSVNFLSNACEIQSMKILSIFLNISADFCNLPKSKACFSSSFYFSIYLIAYHVVPSSDKFGTFVICRTENLLCEAGLAKLDEIRKLNSTKSAIELSQTQTIRSDHIS